MVKKAASFEDTCKEVATSVEAKPEDATEVFKSIIDSIPEVKGLRKRCNSIHDEPVLCIAGQLIKLTAIKSTDLPQEVLDEQRGYKLAHQMLYKGRYGRWNNSITPNLSLMEINWWVAKVAGIEIYLSNGSELIVQESMGSEWDHDFDDGSITVQKQSGVLAVVGAQVHCEYLTVRKTCYINNSTIRCKSGLTIDDISILAADINSKESAYISESDLYDFSVGLGEHVHISDCRLQKAYFHGLRSVNLNKVNSGNNEFTMSLYGLHLDLHIEDVYLQPANINAYAARAGFATSNVNRTQINIKRRIDYGMFSARDSIPFVRLNDEDIIVGGEIFTAKELFPENVVPFRTGTHEQPVVNQDNRGRWGGGPFNSYAEPQCVSYYSRSIRGGDLFNRVAKIVFNNHTDTVVGKSGEILVQSLLEQIRSRVSLYIELKNIL